MFRKNIYLIVLTFVLSLLGGIAAFAQTKGLDGRVVIRKADNTMESVEGAMVEVFRIDSKEAVQQTTTNSRGEFTIASVTAGGTYVISVSGTALAPQLSQNLQAGAKNELIEVEAGDGRRLTEEEVNKIVDAVKAENAALTPEQRKKKAEEEKERQRILAENAKIEASSAIIDRVGPEGIKAFNDGNWDVAIAKFDEGYNASPTYIGSAPVMLNNKGAALVKRATATYNVMAKSQDPVQKSELRPKVAVDFSAAITAYSGSLKLALNGKPEEIAKVKENFEATKGLTLNGAQDCVRLMVRTDAANADQKAEVEQLITEYVAWEKDPKKQEAALLSLGLYMNKIFDFEAAVSAFRKAVEIEPKNPDAIGNLGLSLYTVTYDTEDTARKQEGLNYMQHYLDTAPKDHPLRDGLEGAVKDLISKKMKPQKIAGKN